MIFNDFELKERLILLRIKSELTTSDISDISEYLGLVGIPSLKGCGMKNLRNIAKINTIALNLGQMKELAGNL